MTIVLILSQFSGVVFSFILHFPGRRYGFL